MFARCRDPCAAWTAAPRKCRHYGSAAWEMYPRSRRLWSPQPQSSRAAASTGAAFNPSSSLMDDLVISILKHRQKAVKYQITRKLVVEGRPAIPPPGEGSVLRRGIAQTAPFLPPLPQPNAAV